MRLQLKHRHEHRPRTGDEPIHARSALRSRLALALFGLADALAGIGVFGFWLKTLPFLVLSAILAAVALVNVIVVLVRMRQGAHFQPGRDVPPYRPVDTGDEHRPVPGRRPVSPYRRRVRYVAIIGTALLLIVLAWFWVRYYSVVAAGAMSAVAALLLPLAAIITNADSPILRGEDENRDEGQDENPDENRGGGERGGGRPDRSDRRDTPGDGRSRD